MKLLCFALLFFLALSGSAQQLAKSADSIRVASGIPELGYAVLSSDSILLKNVIGYHRFDRKTPADRAKATDLFHLGSNTKAITGFVAAYLVEQVKISWGTKFLHFFLN